MKKMRVDKLGIDLLSHDPVVILIDEEGKRYLPIIIGPFEATSIALALEGTPIPRPLTHDLMKNVIESLNAKLQKIIIYDIKRSTFYAKIVLQDSAGKVIEVDSRPSDSIALALRMKAPIYVSDKIVLEETIIEKAPEKERKDKKSTAIPPTLFPSQEQYEDEEKLKFKQFLDNLKPSDFLKDLNKKEDKGDIENDQDDGDFK